MVDLTIHGILGVRKKSVFHHFQEFQLSKSYPSATKVSKIRDLLNKSYYIYIMECSTYKWSHGRIFNDMRKS